MSAVAIGLLIWLALQVPLALLFGSAMRSRPAPTPPVPVVPAPTELVPAVPEEGNHS
ncbi:hypothetical protein [Streptomyces sp. CA-111067]|uniref:hypothetical protein n=1 Tax=Streptomyces sp. CA-111067 TaxID=3240046 RepID=UPI003D97E437